jgi:hypothetical protein
MAAIDKLKEILDFKVNSNGKLLPCKINPPQKANANLIALFYNNENVVYKVGRTTRAGVYGTGVQVVVRNNNYDKARTAAFSTLEFLSVNRDSRTGVLMFPLEDIGPIYQGIDESGMENWSFNIIMKGEK